MPALTVPPIRPNFISMRSNNAVLLFAGTFFLAAPVRAQRASSRLDSLDFSGTLFANYQYHADTGVTRGSNKFDIERIYLTFRMPVGEKLGVRITTDIFQAQSADGTVKGWLVRAKYAYLQYDYGTKNTLGGFVRFGILPTAIIDHEETFWPRFISQVAVDRAGLIPPSDGGISNVLRFPNATGELYTAITNGPGYTSRETDRFKDFSARLTLTPLSARGDWLKNLTFSAWANHGAVGSKFSGAAAGQVAPVSSSMPRNRWGLLLAARDPRFTAGVHYGGMTDASESGDNTTASPRVEHDSSGRFVSLYTTFKPARFLSATSKSPFGVVLRYDDFKTNRTTGAGYQLYILGFTADLSSRVGFSLDYQRQNPAGGVTLPRTSTYFAHMVANF
jgi:hypothetical protein